jgi:hypothetical protein
MMVLSNKKEAVKDIFNHLNYKKYDRIDALELISCILVAVEGKFDGYIKNVLYIFGFLDNTQIS